MGRGNSHPNVAWTAKLTRVVVLSVTHHNVQRGAGGPDPGPAGTKIHWGARREGNVSVSLAVRLL